MKESDFLARCARCSGYGHEDSPCSSDAAVLAMELPISEKKSRRGSPDLRGEGNRRVQSDGREKSRGWRARQADRAIYR